METTIRRLMLGLTILSGHAATALADPVAFTWDPFRAAPALVPGPAPFTADAIVFTNFIRTTNVNDLGTLKQSFSGGQLQPITGFTLGGSPVTAPGLNSAYGLYFRISPAGTFPINGSGVTIGPATYTALDISLVADVGYDDGSVSVGATGIGFANPAGLANDIVLATGALVSASLSFNPATGNRNARYVTSFQPAAGVANFFVGPNGPLALEESLLTPAAAFSAIQLDPLTVLNIADGSRGSGGVAQLVPEPASVVLLAAGLLGLGYGRRRRWPNELRGRTRERILADDAASR